MLIVILFIILFFIILFFIIIYFYSNKNKIRSYNDKKRSGYGNDNDYKSNFRDKITFGSLVEERDIICNGTGKAMISTDVEKNNNIALTVDKQYQLKVRYTDKTTNSEWVSSINLVEDIDHIIFKRADDQDINNGDLNNIANSLSVNPTGFEANNLVPEDFEENGETCISKKAFTVTDYIYFNSEDNPSIEIIYQLPDDQEYIEDRTNIILLNIPFKIKFKKNDKIPKYIVHEGLDGLNFLAEYLETVDVGLFILESEIYYSLFTIKIPTEYKDKMFMIIAVDNKTSQNYYKCNDGEAISFKKSDINNKTRFQIILQSEVTCI